MRVLLYRNHHHLPFWPGPDECMGVFIPSDFAGKQFEVERDKFLPVSEMDIWPVLLGLRQLELPFWAHVSAFRADGEKQVWPAYRRWVQITTRPLKEPTSGSRLMADLENTHYQACLWGHDNGTHSPIGLLPKEYWNDPKIKTAEFWSGFFREELLKAKQHADQEAAKAKAFANLFSSMKL